MKQYIFKGLTLAGILLATVPVLAQKEKEKTKNKEEVQQIIVTRTGDADETTVIEIKGDKVKINGKDVKDAEGVNVRVNKLKDINALTRTQIQGSINDMNLNFNMDNMGMSLLAEDSNRAMLGVVTEENDEGAEINSVSRGSAAEKAGLKRGDIITKIGNKKINSADDVTKAIRAQKPGDKVNITVLRDDKEERLTAELGRWRGVRSVIAPTPMMPPPAQWRMENAPNGRSMFMGGSPRLGLSIQDTEDGKGVLVTDVDDESNAAKAGLKEDDVITHINDKEVNTTDEITKIIRENREKITPMRFQVQRKGKSQTLEVRMPRRLKSADL